MKLNNTKNLQELKSYSVNLVKPNEIIIVSGLLKQLDTIFKNKKNYSDISINKNFALDKVCIFISLILPNTDYNNGVKSVQAKKIKKEVGNNYTKIIKLLKDNNIIEVDNSYQAESFSRTYKLADKFDTNKRVTYIIKSERIIKERSIIIFDKLKALESNPIARNELEFYKHVEIPTNAQANARGKELSRQGATTNKGKLITYDVGRNKNSFDNHENRSFVSDALKNLKRIRENGLEIPIVSTGTGGGRVTTSLTRLNSWVRDMLTVNSEPLVSLDFKSLHPAIAQKLYKGSNVFVDHSEIAKFLGTDRTTAKIQHLKFFNLDYNSFESSKIYNFYKEREPKMIAELLEEKRIQPMITKNGKKKRYPVTSEKLFNAESDLMGEIISILNNEFGVYGCYVYDCLMIQADDVEKAKEIMELGLKNNNINTKIG